MSATASARVAARRPRRHRQQPVRPAARRCRAMPHSAPPAARNSAPGHRCPSCRPARQRHRRTRPPRQPVARGGGRWRSAASAACWPASCWAAGAGAGAASSVARGGTTGRAAIAAGATVTKADSTMAVPMARDRRGARVRARRSEDTRVSDHVAGRQRETTVTGGGIPAAATGWRSARPPSSCRSRKRRSGWSSDHPGAISRRARRRVNTGRRPYRPRRPGGGPWRRAASDASAALHVARLPSARDRHTDRGYGEQDGCAIRQRATKGAPR